MLAALAATALIAVSYRLPAEPLAYSMKVDFEGYLPILGGQEDALVNVDMKFVVNGAAPDSDGNPTAVSDLTAVEIKFGGASLPFDIESVRPYFPKNTISHTSLGKIVKTDAPDISLPVRLPGLDVKRFPDITYMPIEFPDGGVEVGKAFEYTKKFGDSSVAYVITPTALEGETLKLEVKMKQSYETLEDEAKNVTAKPEEAFAKVKTDVVGYGTVEFDSAKGIVRDSNIVADAKSIATEIKSGKTSERNLKTTLKVSLLKS